jgi:hypothetical protein
MDDGEFLNSIACIRRSVSLADGDEPVPPMPLREPQLLNVFELQALHAMGIEARPGEGMLAYLERSAVRCVAGQWPAELREGTAGTL